MDRVSDVFPFFVVAVSTASYLASIRAAFEARFLTWVYFGTRPVALIPVAGTVHPFSESDWALDASSSPAVQVRCCYQQQPGAPPPADVLLPGVPSLDWVCTRGGGPPEVGAPGAAPVPRALAGPLLKVAPEGAPAGALAGYASGVRSALVMLPGAGWFRIKGCGAHDRGFLVEHVPPLNLPTVGAAVRARNIRGSSFPKEAVCELAMAARVGRVLARAGCVGANEPVAHALYAGAAQLPLGPAFKTASIVERTAGDRRLGAHALLGLRVLLPVLLRTGGHGGGEAVLRAAFPAARPARDCGAPVATEHFYLDRYIAQLCLQAPALAMANDAVDLMSVTGEEWRVPRSAATLADLTAGAPGARVWLAAAERAGVAALACAAVPPPQWEAAPGGAREMDDAWTSVWGAALAHAARALAGLPPGASALAYLFARLGHDAGAALRALHDDGLAWGTYTDKLSPGTFHINAHSNNFVVLPEGAHPVRLLGVLDLDMAFSAEAWVDVATGAVGKPRAAFARLQDLEYAGMAETMASFCPDGVPQHMIAPLEEDLRAAGPEAPLALSALSDTMMLSFEAAYLGAAAVGGGEPPLFDARLHAAAHAVLRLALILQARYRA